MPPEQSDMFYEAFKLQLTKEKQLKDDKNVMSKEINDYQRKVQMLELENGELQDLKKKYAKLKKEKLEEAQYR